MALNDGIHANSSDGENHRVTNFTWADATARVSNNGLIYAATDLYKEGVQTDTTPPTFWRIDSVNGVGVATFQAIGSAAPSSGATLNTPTINDPIITGTGSIPDQLAGTNNQTPANTKFVTSAINTVLDGVSSTYNTLQKIVNKLTGLTSTDVGLGNVPNVDCTDATNITSGTLAIERLPPSAMERLYLYAGAELSPENFGLTITNVQNGDTVKISNISNANNGLMWIVKDDANLNLTGGFEPYTVGAAASVPWSGVTGRATTVSGYGITDILAQLLTGFVPGAGTVTDTDSILQALQKIVGNIAAISAITASSTDTLTNKRITNRVGGTTSSATPTINTDAVDVYKLAAQAVDITSFTTNLSGTPTDSQFLEIIITGTAARSIAWGASFVASTIALPTTTVSIDTLRVTLQYDSAITKWVCVGVA